MSHKIKLIVEEPKLFIGREGLNIKPGTIVKVNHPANTEGQGTYLLRTNQNSRPFVTLDTGALWYDSIDNYSFEVLPVAQILLELKFIS